MPPGDFVPFALRNILIDGSLSTSTCSSSTFRMTVVVAAESTTILGMFRCFHLSRLTCAFFAFVSARISVLAFSLSLLCSRFAFLWLHTATWKSFGLNWKRIVLSGSCIVYSTSSTCEGRGSEISDSLKSLVVQ